MTGAQEIRRTPDVDEHGLAVSRFGSEALNLSKARLLHDLIAEMYASGIWRDYSNALGRHLWRECEFDYFLIDCEIRRDDAYGVFAYLRDGRRIAEAMDSDDPFKRRPLDEASAGIMNAGPESFAMRAKRLGWVSDSGKVLSAVPERARVLALTGETKDELARKLRRAKIGERRDILDRCVAMLVKEFPAATEMRYIVDELRKSLAKRGRPPADHERWQREVRELDGDVTALAQQWGLSKRGAYRRIQQCMKAAT